jgi:hypothetical protein
MNECQCELAGWCERHQRMKSDRMLHLCKADERYWAKWESTPSHEYQPQLGCDYNHWMPLHYYAVKHWHEWNEQAAGWWYSMWAVRLPRGCNCKENWNEEIKANPVDLSSARGFFEWSWRIHNAVNRRLGKQCQPSLDEAYRLFGAPQ